MVPEEFIKTVEYSLQWDGQRIGCLMCGIAWIHRTKDFHLNHDKDCPIPAQGMIILEDSHWYERRWHLPVARVGCPNGHTYEVNSTKLGGFGSSVDFCDECGEEIINIAPVRVKNTCGLILVQYFPVLKTANEIKEWTCQKEPGHDNNAHEPTATLVLRGETE